MLVKVQNATGELCLEIGMTQEGCQYFQKAWSNLLSFSLSDLRDSQDLMKQKGILDPGRGTNNLCFFHRLGILLA